MTLWPTTGLLGSTDELMLTLVLALSTTTLFVACGLAL